MRFHVAMDSIEKENRILKVAIATLLVLVLGLCVVIMKTALKDPLVIERACLSRIIEPRSPEVTKEEVRSFLEQAIAARFNSDASQPVLLAADQVLARAKEQTELNRQHFKQTVMVNGVEFKDGGIYLVDADRLISAGNIRSAFRFPLKVEIKIDQRSEGNPYGLILTGVEVIDETPGKREK